jgi:hypothetical protein
MLRILVMNSLPAVANLQTFGNTCAAAKGEH